MIGYTDKKTTPLSNYQPTSAVIEITKDFKDGFNEGVRILTTEWEELNGYSVIERMNKDRRTFNSFVDEDIEDPMEAWKWRGTRGIALTKAMALHAHMTAVLSAPSAFAQNDKQEEDRTMSNVMKDILEWMAVNSEYRKSYLLATMGSLVNPVTYLGADYVEAYTTVKDWTEDRQLVTKEVVDEELSGFRFPVYSADQILISNAYEQNIQRQYTVIRRQYKDYHELEGRWSWHPNWQYVQKGIRSIYSEEEGLFYDVVDHAHPSLVEEATGWCRKSDTEVTFLNGIYMGDDNTEANPIKHRDNFNIPKVPFTPFGYQRVNEHFYFYRSFINRIGWDASLIDAMYENTMNREAIDLYAPMGIYGVENFSSQVVFPGAVVAFENPDASAKPLLPPNRGSGYQALREIEKSIEEASVSDVQVGALPEASQKAFTVARAEQNARTILRGVFRSTAESVMSYGSLMADIALRHLTTAQLDEITGATHYRPFILQDQTVNGRNVSKKILFDESLMKPMSKEEQDREGLKMLTKVGWPDNKEDIYRINPHLFSKMKYLVRYEADSLIEKDTASEREKAERMYASMRSDPIVSGEALVRKVLNANYRGEADELMAKEVQQVMGQAPQTPQAPAKPKARKLSTPEVALTE